MSFSATKKIFASLSLLVFLFGGLGAFLPPEEGFTTVWESAPNSLSKVSRHQQEANLAASEEITFPVEQAKYSVTKSRVRSKRPTSPIQFSNHFAATCLIIFSASFISRLKSLSPFQFVSPALRLLRTTVLLH